MILNPTPVKGSNLRPLLSHRESEILFFVAKGMNSPEISEELNISKNTIRVHRRNLYCKLNVKKTAGAVRKGFELGYLSIS